MGKYDRLIYTMPVEHHNWERYVSPRCGYSGTEADPEATVNFGFSVTYDENVMEEPHMHDAKDEYLFFTGADLEHFFESFDAEVEVWLPMYPDGTFSRISRQFLRGDGTATYVYDAVGLGRCRYDPEKVCNYCGKCFSEAEKQRKEKDMA